MTLPLAAAGRGAAVGDDLVEAAKASQIAGGYATDSWNVTTLRAGERVYGGLPGQSAFYTDGATVAAANGSRTVLFESLQVSPHPALGYRPSVGEYRVTKDERVPTGTAAANAAKTSSGAGGGRRLFIEDFDSALELIRRIDLEE